MSYKCIPFVSEEILERSHKVYKGLIFISPKAWALCSV